MRKQDLMGLDGTRRLAQTKNGNVYLIANDYLIGETGFTNFNNFADDLTNIIDKDFSIVRVSNILKDNTLTPECWTSETITENLSWERKEPLPYNQWYKGKLGSIVYFTGETTGWGISNSGAWLNNDQWQPLNSYNWTPATEDEVKTSLINEGLRRGFVDGVRFKSPKGLEYILRGRLVCIEGNNLYGATVGCVFDGQTGIWAEIIEEKLPEYTWDEIKEKLGHNFTIKEK